MKRKRKQAKKNNEQSLFQKYNFELTLLFMFSIGVFLIIEDMEISATLFSFFKNLIFLFADTIKLLRDILYKYLKDFEFSDIVGAGLILLCLFLLSIRWRVKLLNKFEKKIDCPKCKKRLKRIPKKMYYRLLSFIMKLRIYYYQCGECYDTFLCVLEKTKRK